MPVFQIDPNGTQTNSNLTINGGSTTHGVISDASDSSYLSTNEEGETFLDLANMPADWASIDSLTLTIRSDHSGSTDDTHSIDSVVYDSGFNQLASSVEVKNGINWSIENTTVNLTNLVDTSNKTRWDGAILWIIVNETQSMGDDGGVTKIYEAYLTMTYTATGPATQTVNCNVLNATSTLFNPTIINTQEINFNVLNVPGSILSPSVVPPPQTVELQVISAPSTINSSSVVQNIEMQVISIPSTLFNPSTVYDVILPVIDVPSTINNPSVLHRFLISMQLINASSTIFSPTVNQDIALNVLNTTSTIFEPSLVYEVVLPVLNAPDNVLMPATDTSVNIEMLLVTAESTIFNPEVNQDVVLPVVTATETVFNPQVASAGAEQDISLVVIDASSTVLNPSVTTLTTINAEVLEVPSTVFSPTVTQNIEVPVIVTVSTIFSPSLEQIVQLQVINTSPTVYAPRIGEEVDDDPTGAIIKGPDTSPFPIGIR